MNTVRLIPLGVGEAFAARHYTTCLALGVGDPTKPGPSFSVGDWIPA